MLRLIIHAIVATLAMWMGAVFAEEWDAGPRQTDVDNHFRHDWNDARFNRGDALERTLDRAADPLRSNFGPTSNFAAYGNGNGYGNGVQNYGSPNYFNQFYGTPYGGETFPGQWYYQNRRYINPYGGLNQYPSDRYFTR